MTTDPYILLVEDNPGDARLVQSIFDEPGAGQATRLCWVQTVADAMRVIDAQAGCTGVLLDLGLPDSQGLEALATLRLHSADLPLVVLSGNDSEELGLAAVMAGAQDYLVKGSFDGGLLKRSLQYARQRKLAELALIERAMHDELTGLPRRNLLCDRLERAMTRCARERSLGGLLFIDLDGFKAVNDRHGHGVGDALLRAVAQRLAGAVRGSDTVARLGGDEFVVLLPSIKSAQDALAVGQNLLCAIGAPLSLQGIALAPSASIGVAIFHDDSQNAEQLLARADAAMYAAKQGGKGGVQAL